MKAFLKATLPGLWLILALPLAALLLWPLDRIFRMGSQANDFALMSVFLFSHVVTGYFWVRSLLHRAGHTENWIAGISAGLGFGLSIIGGYWASETIFPAIIERIGVENTEHLEFQVIFVAWTAMVTGITGFGLGLGLKNWPLALKLGASGLLIGGGTFYLVALLLDTAGFRVGTPRPDGLPSMPIITVIGIWLAALLGTGMFNAILRQNRADGDTVPV